MCEEVGWHQKDEYHMWTCLQYPINRMKRQSCREAMKEYIISHHQSEETFAQILTRKHRIYLHISRGFILKQKTLELPQ